jgi:membrane-bound lytic murein transglycosylase A
VFPRLWILGVGILCLLGCRGPIPRSPLQPLSSVITGGQGFLVRLDSSQIPSLVDDSSLPELSQAVKKSAGYFRTLPSSRQFYLGSDIYSASEMADSLDTFLTLLELDQMDRTEILKRDFNVYSSVGSDQEGTVVFSSYYEHSLRASLQKSQRYCYPLYGRPPDLEETLVGSSKKVVRVVGGSRRPYFTRKEIDSDHVLNGKGLEIAWAEDPVEIFFLQVQGSGWLLLPNGERLRVRYAGNNGHPYQSVGGAMIERGILPREKFSRKAMIDYLASHLDDRQNILNMNPRYIFFKTDRGPTSPWAYGSLGLPLTPGRSVAMDPAVFPPGALAWIETQGKSKIRRFVVNQDEGGAIKGPARVDYFVGSGEDAEKFAIGFWEKGRFFFLVKKKRH